MTEANNLIVIKCPFKYKSRNTGKIHVCNRPCVKVEPGSKGEAYCRSCSLTFNFEVNTQSEYKSSVRVKR